MLNLKNATILKWTEYPNTFAFYDPWETCLWPPGLSQPRHGLLVTVSSLFIHFATHPPLSRHEHYTCVAIINIWPWITNKLNLKVTSSRKSRIQLFYECIHTGKSTCNRNEGGGVGSVLLYRHQGSDSWQPCPHCHHTQRSAPQPRQTIIYPSLDALAPGK